MTWQQTADCWNTLPPCEGSGSWFSSSHDNDSLDETDGRDESDSQRVNKLFGADPLSRWDDAESIYLGEGANAQFFLVDGIGHERKELQKYSTEFFKNVLSNK